MSNTANEPTRDVTEPVSEQPSVSQGSAELKTAVSNGVVARDSTQMAERLDLTFLSPAQQPDEIGRLGEYRVLKELGRGGMGVVFQAEDPKLKRIVALKVMLPQVARDANNRERFLREAQAAAQLEHDNILTIHHVGEANGVPFIAMPFLKGESLHSRLQREPVLPLADVLRIGGQIAEGLAAAHDLNLIHRDIKPANIWLEDRRAANPPATVATLPATSLAIPSYPPATPLAGVVPAPLRYDPSAPTQQTGSAEAREPLGQAQVAGNSANTRVKILDFGLARLATSGDEQHLTTSGTILGTPSYMAPEQAQGSHKVDHRCDLFSLGAVLYRMATGKLPFTGDGIMQLMYALANSTPATPSDLNPTLPRELSDLIEQLLAKHPTARPATAHEVARRLSELSHTPAATPLATTTLLPATPLAGVVPAPLRYPAPTASTSQSTAPQPAVAQKRGNHPDEQGGGGKTGVASEHSADVSTVILPAAARRRRTLWLSVAAVVLVLAAGAVFQLVSNSRHPQAPHTSTGEPAGVSPRTNSPANDVRGLTPPGSSNDAREPRAPQADDRADWPEWAKEIQEPPPLEEWLKGRKELTVKQDGSAQFTTIQAALDKVQPGEVIRVLDKGPYRERLVSMNHPGNFGLVSEVNTVIKLAEWEQDQDSTTSWLGHLIAETNNIRISGFSLVCQLPKPNAELPKPIYLHEISDLCFENCAVLAPQTREDPLSNLSSEAAIIISPLDRVCLRRVAFGTGVGVGASHNGSYSALVTKCLFARRKLKDTQLTIFLQGGDHRILFDRNSFLNGNHARAITFEVEPDLIGNDQVLVTRNTFSPDSDGVTVVALYGGIGRDVAIRDNLMSASTDGFVFEAVAKPFGATAREQWSVDNNWGGRHDPNNNPVPLTDPSHTGELPYLSLDPEHPNFLRLDPAKLPPNATRIPGALPPGPPPPEGDWFTHLQSRLKEAQAASRAQFP